MENRRKTARLSINDIPDFLQNPVLLLNNEEINATVKNLSPLGVGLIIEKEIIVDKGDIFHLKYYSFDVTFKCVCVFSEVDESGRHIGAYFTNPENQKLILNHLFID